MLGMWRFPVQALVLGVTLCVCLNSASGIKIEVIPSAPKVRNTVIFNVTEVVGAIRFATWYKGQSTNASDQILNFFPPSSQFKGDQYFKEAEGQLNGSLVIANVQVKFSGHYTVQIQTTHSLQQASVLLSVNGVMATVLSPIAPMLGMLLFSYLHFL